MEFFVFKQKTEYEVRISDWSSDVGSSDLTGLALIAGAEVRDQWRLARDARDVAADVDEATDALDAYVATTQEYRLTLIAVVAAEYGITLEQAGDLLGIDFAVELEEVRDRVSEIPLIAVLEERVAEPGDLALGRAVLDESSREHPVFADVVIEAEKTWQTRMGSLGDDRAETTVDTDVRRSLYALRTSANLFEIAKDKRLPVHGLMGQGENGRAACGGT